MREIKFKFHCGGHGMTEGFTLQELLSGKARVITSDGIDISTCLWNDPILTPLQYTGLKDKNGKEIYEGDLIKIPVTGNRDFHGEWSVHEIIYKSGMWVSSYVYSEKGFKFPLGYTAGHLINLINDFDKDSFFEDFLGNIEDFEIVGNIHEHPHLLEVKQ